MYKAGLSPLSPEGVLDTESGQLRFEALTSSEGRDVNVFWVVTPSALAGGNSVAEEQSSLYSLEYIDMPTMFFTPYHVGHCARPGLFLPVLCATVSFNSDCSGSYNDPRSHYR